MKEGVCDSRPPFFISPGHQEEYLRAACPQMRRDLADAGNGCGMRYKSRLYFFSGHLQQGTAMTSYFMHSIEVEGGGVDSSRADPPFER
ncbi:MULTISPECIES: hypothetical protein [Paenibacillus]|uniref:Uncharacterized protein n=1 Tax=Paenibacillus vulneris TaxID=1133364 RepID=A0ABW3UN13_9BACL|nr:hypothetical protein [Paenibacillus sp. 32352]